MMCWSPHEGRSCRELVFPLRNRGALEVGEPKPQRSCETRTLNELMADLVSGFAQCRSSAFGQVQQVGHALDEIVFTN